MELIDKAAVVAELKKRIDEINLDIIEDWRYRLQREHDVEISKNILYLINSLEAKEVDLDKIIEQTYHDRSVVDTSDIDHVIYENIARYFFELGLNARKEN